MTLTPTDQLLLSSVKINPSVDDLERIDTLLPLIGDWNYLAQTAFKRGIAPLLFKKIHLLPHKNLIPPDALTLLQQSYYKTLSRSMVIYEAFRKVAEALTAQGIHVIALKGIYLSEWMYKDIGLRQFSDIDLLVKKEDGEKSLEILTSIGYISTANSLSSMITEQVGITHYPAMVKNNVSVEIHVNLHSKKNAFQLNPENLIRNSLPVKINSVHVHTLDLNDLLIFLCIHLDKHFNANDVQFTGFIDISNILDLQKDAIDWSELTIRCKEYKCEDVVFKYLLMVNKYFNVSLPDIIYKEYETCLTEHDASMFYHYLHGITNVGYGFVTHLENLKMVKGLMSKIKYFLAVVFPPKKFMMQSYPIKNHRYYGFYYLYRYWTGLKGVIKWVAKKIFRGIGT